MVDNYNQYDNGVSVVPKVQWSKKAIKQLVFIQPIPNGISQGNSSESQSGPRVCEVLPPTRRGKRNRIAKQVAPSQRRSATVTQGLWIQSELKGNLIGYLESHVMANYQAWFGGRARVLHISGITCSTLLIGSLVCVKNTVLEQNPCHY